ncbi:XRE family transcriptional regulator [Nocardia rhizosphaerae]|uniref:XRE family transcriptional regulator n=1 Tax=Nocardia rhizosphaerae TaxID=1691571 RepID=A0ABV8L9P0_9NOCA
MAGYGSAEFAALIGVSRNTVSAIEGDRTNVRRIVANAWGMATGVPVVWLETGTAPSPSGDGAAECAIRDSNPEPAD